MKEIEIGRWRQKQRPKERERKRETEKAEWRDRERERCREGERHRIRGNLNSVKRWLLMKNVSLQVSCLPLQIVARVPLRSSLSTHQGG